jgi:predicted dehydrogenase
MIIIELYLTKSEMDKTKEKLGIALVGLGSYATKELAPSLKKTDHCYLAGLVSAPDKVKKLKKKYDIPRQNIYTYENFDTIKDNPEIDIVYIVLPNSMHEEYVIRSAGAGKHVICEKPMAITVEQCDRMINACRQAGKMFSIGYRLHFEPYNQEMMRIGRDKPFGNIIKLTAQHGMEKVKGWRINKNLAGGGPLMDLGIYCIQACRYTTGMEPVAVRARELLKTKPEKFQEVEEALAWQMEFPGGIIAECETSYTKGMDCLRVECTNGWAQLEPAFAYKGIKGKSSAGKMKFKKVKQQAKQMDNFALAIKQNRLTSVPGEMGRQDVKILQAIYWAMISGERVEIE